MEKLKSELNDLANYLESLAATVGGDIKPGASPPNDDDRAAEVQVKIKQVASLVRDLTKQDSERAITVSGIESLIAPLKQAGISLDYERLRPVYVEIESREKWSALERD